MPPRFQLRKSHPLRRRKRKRKRNKTCKLLCTLFPRILKSNRKSSFCLAALSTPSSNTTTSKRPRDSCFSTKTPQRN